MKLSIQKLTKEMVTELLSWQYDPPYDLYNNDPTDEAIAEFLDGSYLALINEQQELVGYFCTGKNAQVPAGNAFGVYEDRAVDMGLGMKPSLTGKGYGLTFCSAIISYIEEYDPHTIIRLTVATFNKRAIRLYENLGFIQAAKFSTNTTEFMTMRRK